MNASKEKPDAYWKFMQMRSAVEDAFMHGFEYGIASDIDDPLEAWEDCVKNGFLEKHKISEAI